MKIKAGKLSYNSNEIAVNELYRYSIHPISQRFIGTFDIENDIIKIITPVRVKANVQFAFKVYLSGSYNFVECEVSGYSYRTSETWYNADATILNSNLSGLLEDGKLKFHFGKTEDDYLYVGIQMNTPLLAYYPFIYIKDVKVGINNTNVDINNNWQIQAFPLEEMNFQEEYYCRAIESSSHFVLKTGGEIMGNLKVNGNDVAVVNHTHDDLYLRQEERHSLYPDKDKIKLAGIASGANNYVHPDNGNTRHVTDTQISDWNSKAEKEHSHDSIYVKQEVGKGLSANDFTNAYKTRLENAIVPSDVQTVTSLSDMPVNKYNLIRIYTTSTSDTISFAMTPVEGFECIISIKNNTDVPINQVIPNSTSWQSEDESLDIPGGEVREISIRYICGTYIVRT